MISNLAEPSGRSDFGPNRHLRAADGDWFVDGRDGRRGHDEVRQRLRLDVVSPSGDGGEHVGVIGRIEDLDPCYDFEVGVFAELLHLADEVAGDAFLDEVWRQECAEGDLDALVVGAEPFGGLLGADEDVGRREDDVCR